MDQKIKISEEKMEKKVEKQLNELNERIKELSAECNELKKELEEKNRALERSRRDQEILQQQLNQKTVELEAAVLEKQRFASAINKIRGQLDVSAEKGMSMSNTNLKSAQIMKE
ncbi:radixin-like [Pecten maximus]|uniref:radixin-like n=1 Tax=Pecten maximus TaxID=6579 RepID=UPI00145862E5|nr:radixin-like [Pecten maximus]